MLFLPNFPSCFSYHLTTTITSTTAAASFSNLHTIAPSPRTSFKRHAHHHHHHNNNDSLCKSAQLPLHSHCLRRPHQWGGGGEGGKEKEKKKATRNKEVNLVAQDRKCLIHKTRCEFLAFCVGAVNWPPLARVRPETKIDVSARTALRKRPFLEASGGKSFSLPF